MALAEHKITHVVSLIEEAEVVSCGLGGEEPELARQAIGFTRFPVDDFDTPEAFLFDNLINDLYSRLNNGENLFLHCYGGVGRAGITASCLLIRFGSSPDAAMTHVSKARGIACPETPAQQDFIRNFSSTGSE